MSSAQRILFVCEANVCRSPLMEAVFRASFPSEAWHVSSRGTKVPRGAREMCATAARVAGVLENSHVPTQITAQDILDHGLVITAGRAERAAVVEWDRAAREKTFTLREALLLGAPPAHDPVDHGAPGDSNGSGADGPQTLDQYVAALHHRRGLVDLPEVRRVPILQREPIHPLDIRDVHGLGPLTHRSTLRSTMRRTQLLGEQLRSAEISPD